MKYKSIWIIYIIYIGIYNFKAFAKCQHREQVHRFVFYIFHILVDVEYKNWQYTYFMKLLLDHNNDSYFYILNKK